MTPLDYGTTPDYVAARLCGYTNYMAIPDYMASPDYVTSLDYVATPDYMATLQEGFSSHSTLKLTKAQRAEAGWKLSSFLSTHEER